MATSKQVDSDTDTDAVSKVRKFSGKLAHKRLDCFTGALRKIRVRGVLSIMKTTKPNRASCLSVDFDSHWTLVIWPGNYNDFYKKYVTWANAMWAKACFFQLWKPQSKLRIYIIYQKIVFHNVMVFMIISRIGEGWNRCGAPKKCIRMHQISGTCLPRTWVISIEVRVFTLHAH